MARSQRKYDYEYKVQAVKLAKEIGGVKAAKELVLSRLMRKNVCRAQLNEVSQ